MSFQKWDSCLRRALDIAHNIFRYKVRLKHFLKIETSVSYSMLKSLIEKNDFKPKHEEDTKYTTVGSDRQCKIFNRRTHQDGLVRQIAGQQGVPSSWCNRHVIFVVLWPRCYSCRRHLGACRHGQCQFGPSQAENVFCERRACKGLHHTALRIVTFR